MPGVVKTRTAEEVQKMVRSIIIELLPNPVSEVGEDAKLVDELGYHSLALLELAFALEDEFDLQPIDEKTARKIITIKDVERHILRELESTGKLVQAQQG